MTLSERPRLGLAGIMVLIGASAPSMAAYLRIDNGLFGGQRYLFGLFTGGPTGGWTVAYEIERLTGVLGLPLILFGAWTLALPALALRLGRRSWQRLARGPGIAACLAVDLGLCSWGGIAAVVLWVQTGLEHKPIPPAYWSVAPIFDGLLASAGVAVVVAWGLQALTGRWRPQPNAYDRIGRGLGVMWLAVGLIFAARRLAL